MSNEIPLLNDEERHTVDKRSKRLTKRAIGSSAEIYVHPEFLTLRTPPSARLVDIHDQEIEMAIMIEISRYDVGYALRKGDEVGWVIAESNCSYQEKRNDYGLN